jgi:hypothetical protein
MFLYDWMLSYEAASARVLLSLVVAIEPKKAGCISVEEDTTSVGLASSLQVS